MNSPDPIGKTAMLSTRKGETVLMRTVNRGHIYCVKMLLQAGVDVNVTYFYGTPLIKN